MVLSLFAVTVDASIRDNLHHLTDNVCDNFTKGTGDGWLQLLENYFPVFVDEIVHVVAESFVACKKLRIFR